MSDDVPMLTGILGAFRAGLGRRAGLDDVHRRRAGRDHRRLRAARRAGTPEFAGAVAEALRVGRRRSSTSCSPGTPALAVPARRALHAWDELVAAGEAARRRPASRRRPTGRPLGAVALHLGHHRPAQGRDAPARQHPPRLRDVRRTRCSASRPTTRRSRSPRCSSPTASATPCSSRSRSAPRTVLEPRRPTPRVVARAARGRTRPTLFFARPHLLRRAGRPRPARRRLRLGAAVRLGRRAAAGAAAASASPTGSGSTILDGIGSTEALHIFLSNRPATIRPGTRACRSRGTTWRSATRRAPVARRRAGRAASSGASRSRSATGTVPSASRQVFQGEWLSTGDTYVRDEDGYFTCLGRNTDMLKAGGIWVSPAEVESRLLEHPRVRRPPWSGSPTPTASTSRSPSWWPTGRRRGRSWSPGAATAWPTSRRPRQVDLRRRPARRPRPASSSGSRSAAGRRRVRGKPSTAGDGQRTTSSTRPPNPPGGRPCPT